MHEALGAWLKTRPPPNRKAFAEESPNGKGSGEDMRFLSTLIAGALSLAAAQNGAVQFGAASVKSNRAGGVTAPFGIGFLSGGRFTATNVTLQRLIAVAYGSHQLLPTSRMVGGPGWIATDRFDVLAKTDDPDAAREVDGVPRRFLMLRTLLADRFRLVVHNESRALPIYALVIARSDKKLGPRLRASTIDCAESRARADATAPPPPPRPDERPSCSIDVRGYSLVGGGVTMSQLANALSDRADRVVVDRTSLTGTFDLDLAWTPSASASQSVPPGVQATDSSALVSIFTALQEQLGLKLESTKGPVDVLVIDHAEHPAAD